MKNQMLTFQAPEGSSDCSVEILVSGGKVRTLSVPGCSPVRVAVTTGGDKVTLRALSGTYCLVLLYDGAWFRLVGEDRQSVTQGQEMLSSLFLACAV